MKKPIRRYINPREFTIINEKVARGVLNKNKYNFPLLHDIEQYGEVSDRTPYDAGMWFGDGK